MKLFKYAVLLASSLTVFTGFASTPAPDCATNFAVITFGTQFGIPPYDVLGAAGVPANRPTGFDVDIACELRKRLGYQTVNFKAVNPDNAATLLATGVVSAIISPLNEINPTLLGTAGVALIKYSDMTFGLLFNGPVPADINAANALDRLAIQGKVFGVIANSFEQNIVPLLPSGSGGTQVAPFPTVADAIVALKAGTIDVFFSNTVVVQTANASDNSLTPLPNVILPVGADLDPFRATGLAIEVSPTCCQLYVNIRQALADMLADGKYEEIAKANKISLTTFTPGPDLTPAACANVTPKLVERNEIAEFIFEKFCKCAPVVVPTVTVSPTGGMIITTGS